VATETLRTDRVYDEKRWDQALSPGPVSPQASRVGRATGVKGLGGL
jgi:hypothetical protein